MSIQVKKLSDVIYGLSLDENDLVQLAHIIHNITDDNEKKLEITITSFDEEDILKSNDPDIFLKPQMIKKVKKIKLSYTRVKDFNFLEPAIDVQVELFTNEIMAFGLIRPDPILEVRGTDTEKVISVFHELKKCLRQSTRIPIGLSRFLRTPFILGPLSILTAGSLAYIVFNIFDIPIDLLVKSVPGFGESAIRSIIMAIGWICVFSALAFGTWIGDRIFLQIFPPVTFTGRLSDSSSGKRKAIFGLFTIFILPIIVNLISDYLLGQ